jgi:hypothetical protein
MISDATVNIMNALVKISGRQAAKLEHDNPYYSSIKTTERARTERKLTFKYGDKQLLQVSGRQRGHP